MALPPMAQALDRDSGREVLFSEPADLAMVHRVRSMRCLVYFVWIITNEIYRVVSE